MSRSFDKWMAEELESSDLLEDPIAGNCFPILYDFTQEILDVVVLVVN
jgi:hypothetical protein